MTITNDWYPVSLNKKYKLQNANGVPWPLDEYLDLQCKPTTLKTAKLVEMLGGMGKK